MKIIAWNQLPRMMTFNSILTTSTEFPKRRPLLLVALGFFLVGIITGCATKLSVTSEPAGAQVMWSPSGVEDWRPWPPRTWNPSPFSANLNEPKEPVLTPFSDAATYSDTVWITVEKEGYYRPLPKVAQLYSQNHEKLTFTLVETPALQEQRLLAAGFVPYKGEFVKPEELNLVEYNGDWMTAPEADLRQKQDAGLVEFEGQWVTIQQREELFAANQMALGFIQFKDRWVKPEVKTQELLIDEYVTELFLEPSTPLRAPRVVGTLNQNLAQLQVHNSSRVPIRVYLSGTRSDQLILNAYETYGATETQRYTVIPGDYRIAIVPQNPIIDSSDASNPAEVQELNVLPKDASEIDRVSTTTTNFNGGIQYLVTFELNPQQNGDNLEEYQRQEPVLPEGLPKIVIPEINLPAKPQGPPGAGGGRSGGGRSRE